MQPQCPFTLLRLILIIFQNYRTLISTYPHFEPSLGGSIWLNPTVHWCLDWRSLLLAAALRTPRRGSSGAGSAAAPRVGHQSPHQAWTRAHTVTVDTGHAETRHGAASQLMGRVWHVPRDRAGDHGGGSADLLGPRQPPPRLLPRTRTRQGAVQKVGEGELSNMPKNSWPEGLDGVCQL